MNTPPNFKYSKLSNMYNIPKIPGLSLGADNTMVVLDQGGCASNINGVNKTIDHNRYGNNYLGGGNQSYSYCVKGSNNFFDSP